MKSLKLTVFALTLLVVFTSCATNGSGNFCQIAEPILISEEDHLTTQTLLEIIEHNEVWEALCG